MTSLDWFRSWHGAPTDNKWLLIGRRACVAPGMASAIGWALIDYASQQQERGSVIGFDTETYAAFSGWDEDDICAVIDAMQDKSMIVNGRLSAWEKRQPEREDPTATERKRKQRERDSAQQVRDIPNKEGASRTVTSMSHNVTQGHAPDKDRDKDLDQDDLGVEAVQEPPARAREAEAPAPAPQVKTQRLKLAERALAALDVQIPPDDQLWLEKKINEQANLTGIPPDVLLAEMDVGRQTERWINRDKATQRGSWRNWMDDRIAKVLKDHKAQESGVATNGKRSLSAAERDEANLLAIARDREARHRRESGTQDASGGEPADPNVIDLAAKGRGVARGPGANTNGAYPRQLPPGA